MYFFSEGSEGEVMILLMNKSHFTFYEQVLLNLVSIKTMALK